MEKELIFVSKEIAKKYKSMGSDKEKLNIVLECMENAKTDIRNSIVTLDEDLLLFKGFALKYKESLKEAYVEQSLQFEKIWEDFGDIDSKIYKRIETLKTRTNRTKQQIAEVSFSLKELDNTVSKMSIYGMQNLIELVEKFSEMSDDNKGLLKMLLTSHPRKEQQQ